MDLVKLNRSSKLESGLGDLMGLVHCSSETCFLVSMTLEMDLVGDFWLLKNTGDGLTIVSVKGDDGRGIRGTGFEAVVGTALEMAEPETEAAGRLGFIAILILLTAE